MQYLTAFLACGLIGLVLQMLLENTKLGFGTLFAGGLCVGVLLTVAGVMRHLVEFGSAGVIITVINAGEAIYYGFTGLAEGDSSLAMGFWGMIFSIFAVSAVCGLFIGHRRRRS